MSHTSLCVSQHPDCGLCPPRVKQITTILSAPDCVSRRHATMAPMDLDPTITTAMRTALCSMSLTSRLLLIPPHSLACSSFQQFWMPVHTRHDAEADGAPDGFCNLPLVHPSQSRLTRMLDPAHLRHVL